MITPGYSVTATERVLPKMALDFTTALLDPRVTVTRALNTATRINSSGLIEVVNANLPRFDFTLGSGGACKGLLIEESRSNSLFNSNDLTWWTFNSTTGSIVKDAAISPDGTQNASSITINGAVGEVRGAVSGLTGAVTFSAYLKGTAGQTLLLGIGAASGSNAVQVTLTNTWVRYSITAPSVSGLNRVYFGLWGGLTASNFQAYGVQIEQGLFETSLIPTTAGAVTRNADDVSMTGTNFSDWYNATEGTFVVTGNIPFFGSGTRRFLSANDGTINNSLQLAMGGGGTSGYFEARVSTAAVVSASVGTVATNSFYTYALGYKLDNYAYSANASSTVVDTTAAVPTVTQLSIGYHTTSVWINGYISKIKYFPQRLINAEIQAQSK